MFHQKYDIIIFKRLEGFCASCVSARPKLLGHVRVQSDFLQVVQSQTQLCKLQAGWVARYEQKIPSHRGELGGEGRYWECCAWEQHCRNMNNPTISYCGSHGRYEAQKLINNCEDIPEDLSVKHKTVSVQTEMSIQDKLEEIFEGFSHTQINFFMEILSNLKKSKEDGSFVMNWENIRTLSEKASNCQNPT